ncbi:hypothetical protein Tco_1575713 [Tanacetum coccineum]
MAAHTGRMKRFKEAIYKQEEEINVRMTDMFSLFKEYTKGKSLKKVLVREEVSKPITKYVNDIFLVRMKNSEDKESDQGSDVNIMPLMIYNKLTSKKPIRTNISLSLANHSYVYPEGITEDVLIDVSGFVRILEWEERIENCKDGKIKFGKWREKMFDDKNLVRHHFFIYDHELENDGSGVSAKGESRKESDSESSYKSR